jgi:hypothetical protein
VGANATDTPVLWHSSGAFSGRDQNALDELSKLQHVGVTTDEEDTSSGERSKVTSVMCLRVGGKVAEGAATGAGPWNKNECWRRISCGPCCYLEFCMKNCDLLYQPRRSF